MEIFEDYQGRSVTLTDERLEYFENQHPEMVGQLNRISETLKGPHKTVELFYNHYKTTAVSEKILCVVVKHHVMTIL